MSYSLRKKIGYSIYMPEVLQIENTHTIINRGNALDKLTQKDTN